MKEFHSRLKNLCGVATLCAGAIFSLLSVAFMGIAFATNNWVHISVNRNELLQSIEAENDTKAIEEFQKDIRFFDRVEGLFHVCFPMSEKPPVDHETIYLNPVDEWCTNIDLYWGEMVENGQLIPDKVTTHGQTYIHLLRTCVIAFALYFAFMGLAFQVGVLGCWKVSSRKIICTSVLITLAFFFGTSGLILFEGVKYFERYKVLDKRMKFFQTWPTYLKTNTEYTLGWSYIICIVGLVFTILSAVCLGIAGWVIRKFTFEQKQEKLINEQLSNHMERVAAGDQYNPGTLRRFGSIPSLRGVMAPSDFHNMNPMTSMYNPKIFPDNYQSLPHFSDDTSYTHMGMIEVNNAKFDQQHYATSPKTMKDSQL